MPSDDSTDLVAPALEVIAQRGYDQVTADDLAAAVGLSRSTFFRRFGTKDDVVFADHERLLTQLIAFLSETSLDSTAALLASTRIVLDYHVNRRDLTVLRQELVRNHSTLRDRELVLIPRYERAFAAFLTRVHPDAPAWAVSALASGVVAVHNAVIRRWLKEDTLDVAVELESSLAQLIALFNPVLSDAEVPARQVMVASFVPGTKPEDVLAAVAKELGV